MSNDELVHRVVKAIMTCDDLAASQPKGYEAMLNNARRTLTKHHADPLVVGWLDIKIAKFKEDQSNG